MIFEEYGVFDYLLFLFKVNLALQGYLRAHPRSGRWLVGFGWGVVVG